MTPLADDWIVVNLEHLILAAVMLALCSSALVAVWQELADRAWERRDARRRERLEELPMEPPATVLWPPTEGDLVAGPAPLVDAVPEAADDPEAADPSPPIPREYDRRPMPGTLAELLAEHTKDETTVIVDPPPVHRRWDWAEVSAAADAPTILRLPPEPHGWTPPAKWAKSANGLHRFDCPAGLTVVGLPQLLTVDQAAAYAEEHVLRVCATCRPLDPEETRAQARPGH